MEFISVGWTDGKMYCYDALNVGYWVWKLGMDRSREAALISFLSVFSNAFHSLMDLELVVSSFKYFP